LQRLRPCNLTVLQCGASASLSTLLTFAVVRKTFRASTSTAAAAAYSFAIGTSESAVLQALRLRASTCCKETFYVSTSIASAAPYSFAVGTFVGTVLQALRTSESAVLQALRSPTSTIYILVEVSGLRACSTALLEVLTALL